MTKNSGGGKHRATGTSKKTPAQKAATASNFQAGARDGRQVAQAARKDERAANRIQDAGGKGTHNKT